MVNKDFSSFELEGIEYVKKFLEEKFKNFEVELKLSESLTYYLYSNSISMFDKVVVTFQVFIKDTIHIVKNSFGIKELIHFDLHILYIKHKINNSISLIANSRNKEIDIQVDGNFWEYMLYFEQYMLDLLYLSDEEYNKLSIKLKEFYANLQKERNRCKSD